MEPPEALFELLLRNMLVVTEDNYVNCFEPRFKPSNINWACDYLHLPAY